jgi:hypothetical protein
MSEHELYDCTRGVWVLSHKREQARYAFAIYQGEVLEVYEIESWHRAGTTSYLTREIEPQYSNRWEFAGKLARDDLRQRYVGRSVSHYFKRGEANPVKYVNCPKP